MKKILLVFPKGKESIWDMKYALNIIGKKSFIPPLGLLTVAALTPERFSVRIVDETVEAVDYETDCDLVGIASYTYNSARMLEIAGEFRKRKILTVCGGPFCSTDLELCKEVCDVVFVGEVENTWVRFLEDWEQGYPAKVYAHDGYSDIADLPMPRWNLINLDLYSAGILQTSRGCIYDCEFCDVVSIIGRKIRCKSYGSVEREVRVLAHAGVGTIWIADDNFTWDLDNAKRLLALFAAINKELKTPIRYITQITLDKAVDEELARLLMAANFYSVLIGIESSNYNSLVVAKKYHNTRVNVYEAINLLHSYGICVVAGMIVGFDSDDAGIFKEQESFILQAGLVVVIISMLKASKGTKLWNRYEKEGRLTGSDDGDYYSPSNFIPEKMSGEELSGRYHLLMKKIFSYSSFKKRFTKYLSQIDLAKTGNGGRAKARICIKDMVGIAKIVGSFVLSRDRVRRMFFIMLLKKSMAKGMVGLHAMFEYVVWYESQRIHVQKYLERER